MTPTVTMQRYYESWNAGDFDALEALFADEVTFAGPMGTADGPAECRKGLEAVASMTTDRRVVAMLAVGPDVITWFELYAAGVDPMPVANWARVEDGKIRRLRATFDPRPLLG